MAEHLAKLLAERFAAFRDREKQIEEELKTYRSLLDVAPCPMLLTSQDGLVEYVNTSYCEMLGIRQEQALADGWKSVVAEDDLERTTLLWQMVIDSQLKEFSAWAKLKTVSGVIQVFWRVAKLPTGSYAVALFHPACAFFKYPSGCGYVLCDAHIHGTIPGVAK